MADNTTPQNLTAYRGDDFGVRLEFTNDSDGTAIPITGWEIFFTIKNKKTDTDDQAIIQKNVTAFFDAPGGIALVTLTNLETANLHGSYFYDFQYKDSAGAIQTIVSGTITFLTDITRRIS